MPEEVAAPDAPAAESAEAPAQDEQPNPNEWLRERASGLTAQPAESRPSRSQQWDEANAELRRGRRAKEEAPAAEESAKTDDDQGEAPASRPERDEKDFDRRVQAEVDRREAVRAQRAEAQRERDLRRTNPQEYARLKEQQEAQNATVDNLTGALKMLSAQFDDATVTPLVQALDENLRAEVLKDPGHGMDGRKEIVKRAVAALKKASYEEGVKKGREEAQKSLRRNPSFRKELLTELRGSEDEPELANASGSSRNDSWDMNDWMRTMTGRNGRAARE